MASIERECELALINAVSAASVTSYTSERDTARLLPNVTAKATLTNELLGPFTGVFGLSATLTYTARADTGSRAGFDNEFESIVQELYQSPNLASYMTAHSNLTVYKASINSETGSIVANNRTWKRDISLSIQASAAQATIPIPIPTNGLSLWLKADAGITLSGSSVTAWADQSGNGNNVNDVANMPMLVNNLINGYPAIYFRGTDYLYNSAFTTEGLNTFFNVVKFLSGNRVFTSINTNILIGSYGGYSDRMYNQGWIFEGTSESTDWKLNSAYFGGESSFYQNGILLGTGNGENQLDGISIGGHPNWEDGAGTAECYHAEVIMYNRAVTESERQQIEAYLNTKYAVY